MIKLYTDFQAIEDDGACWILKYGQSDMERHADELHLSNGDTVLLDAYEGFEVLRTLDYKFVRALGRDGWVAYPDWSTRVETREG
jgi:hypothetical protein